jgi:hypothetical protein
MYLIKKIFNPQIFQGKYKKKNYFEGWYFKNIDNKKQNALAVIPGISYDNNHSDVHAFIQILNMNENKLNYFKYDISCFKFNEQCFEIEIERNYFSTKEMILEIDTENVNISSHLSFKNIIPYPKKLFWPGIMGPFSFVPFMECYHGIVNIHHDVAGEIKYNDVSLDFSDGYGYIEKDWGQSFPSAWIWLQSNHFEEEKITLMFSIAKIPCFRKEFTAFICFFKFKDRLIKFATYTRAKIKKLNLTGNNIEIIIEDSRYMMKLHVFGNAQGSLKAPKDGKMEREILESIDARVIVELMGKNADILYKGVGTNTGLEIVCNEHDFKV